MANAQEIGLALQGLSAGLSGRGGEFQQNMQRQQALEQENSRVQEDQARAADLERKKTLFTDSEGALNLVNNGRWDLAASMLGERSDILEEMGIADTRLSDNMADMATLSAEGNEEAQQNLLKQLNDNVLIGQTRGFLQAPEAPEATAEQRTFDALTEGLSEDDKTKARMIKLGLSPRAASLSAVERIAGDKALTDAVANSQQTIKEREKFGVMTGASRAKTIDSGFDKLAKIDGAVRNIDRAISVLDKGAGVGAIEKFLPSFKAASVELDNIQGSMALDVVGATTFGALSAGELQLAKEVALPTGLETDELIDYLGRKKAAQNKLRDYFNEQIQFLDQGATVAGFLRQKEREATAGEAQGQAPQAPVQALPSGVTEDDITTTMQANNMTREQVMARLRGG